jgi:hypothetical protein
MNKWRRDRTSVPAETFRPSLGFCNDEAMRQDPGPLPFLQEALAIATFEPGMYEDAQSDCDARY